MPEIGEQAPDFELLNQDGKSVKLSDYRGRKVVIFAYPAAFTSGCTTQACGFRDSYPQVETANAVVLGLSPDDVQKLHDWKEAEKLPYDLLSDPDHKVLEQWGAWGEKNNYGKKYMGVIRSHWVIDESGKVVDTQINIKPVTSVERALITLGGK
jgi:thioredoxin-dependent peroxiredoxin